MTDLIIIAILVVIIGSAVAYIMKAKKSGVKCIGCPEGGSCAHKDGEASGCGCGCGCESESSCNCNGNCHADTK